MATESPEAGQEPADIMARPTAEPEPAAHPHSHSHSPTVPSHWQRLREGLPLLMSVLAFAVSLSSLYLVTLRSGNVTAMSGPVLAISHDPITGAARIGLAVNLANSGARLITVAGLQLRVLGPDQTTPLQLTALTLQALDDKGEPRDTALLAPITLAARSESTYQLGFVAANADMTLLQPGRYAFALHLKTATGEQMQLAEQWQISLTETDIRQLQQWYQLNIGNSVMVAKP